MKKTIIKTAIFTVLSLVVALFVGIFSIFMFAPKLSARICHNLGLKDLSTSCYERVYKKTGELEDLIEVIDSAVYAENKDSVIEYGVLLFDIYGETNRFFEYCNACDADLEEGGYPTFDYYANTVFVALYSQGKKTEAADFAIKNMREYKGTDDDKSVLKTALILADPTNDKVFGNLLVSAYRKMSKEVSTSEYALFVRDMKQYKDADGNQVYKF